MVCSSGLGPPPSAVEASGAGAVGAVVAVEDVWRVRVGASSWVAAVVLATRWVAWVCELVGSDLGRTSGAPPFCWTKKAGWVEWGERQVDGGFGSEFRLGVAAVWVWVFG